MGENVEYRFWVGIDWGTLEHEICVIDGSGTVLHKRVVKHGGQGLAEFAAWLSKLATGNPGEVAIAIETPRGAVVETLVEREFHVYSINPKQLDRFRDRHTVAGAKDDRLDAFVLADSLRTDLKLYRKVRLDPARIVELRELARLEDDLVKDRARLCNQLRDCLLRYYPELLSLCPAADERWAWAILDLATTPEAAHKLREARVERVLRTHRIRRVSADQVVAALRVTPLRVAPGTVEGASIRVKTFVTLVRLVDEQHRDCERRIGVLLDCLEESGLEADGPNSEHRDDVRILRSLPGLGNKGVAVMLSEASQPLADRDYHTLRTRGGVAPVTSQTGKQGKVRGKHPRVSMRRACNWRFREAMHHWARVATQHDPRAKQRCAAQLATGHTYGSALRVVGDRLLAVLVTMLRNQTVYDPTLAEEAAARAAGTSKQSAALEAHA